MTEQPHISNEELERRLTRSSEIKTYSFGATEQSLSTLKGILPDIALDSFIAYPGSAADLGAANVFGRGVIHIDPDAESMKVLNSQGYIGITSTFEDYITTLGDAEQIDMIYSHNAGLVPDSALAKLRLGGYVIANNWHGSANDMGERTDFDIVGAVADGTTEIVSPERARKGLGTYELAIDTRGGKSRVVANPEEIDAIRNEPGVIVDDANYRNTEVQFLFKKSRAMGFIKISGNYYR